MPTSELFSSLRLREFSKGSHSKQPSGHTQHKASLSSDTTVSGVSEETAVSPEDTPDYLKANMDEEHTVTLSLLDQGMPRHYTRVCLGFRLGETAPSEPIMRLEAFFRRTFQSKPWLAGYACPVRGESSLADQLEIRFSQRHVEDFSVKVQELGHDDFRLTYDEFCDLGMPPSKIPRDVVSTCPDRRPDTEPAPILDVTVNIIRGGLLVSIFFHHGVIDGASMGTIISGQFCRGACSADSLAAAAQAETTMRQKLSLFPAGQALGFHPEYRTYLRATNQDAVSPSGPGPAPSEVRSRIFLFPDSALKILKDRLGALMRSRPNPGVPWLTTHDALQSLLWHHLTRARLTCLNSGASETVIEGSSTLLIPVNVRKRIDPPLPSSYLGGGAALVPATLPLARLVPRKDSTSAEIVNTLPSSPPSSVAADENQSCYLDAAITIHTAVSRCTDSYLREVLALTAQQSSARNMVHLNADQASGLDLVITSWSVLPVFDDDEGSHASSAAKDSRPANSQTKGQDSTSDTFSTTGMGMNLGPPDYIRKPYSRDAGGCIILPRDRRWKKGRKSPGRHHDDAGQHSGTEEGGKIVFEPGIEVLIQLKTADMHRLMQDEAFMRWVGRVID